jgi:mono/diheme cytochrome c family protein
MSEGTSERRAATLEASPSGNGPSIPEGPSAAPAARRFATPARTRTPRETAVAVFKGLANVVFMALVIYLTYFFTMFFSTRPPAPVPESARVAAKKIEELLAEERKLLTTYGPANPATGSVRIPIDRAMELVVAEAARPGPTPAASPTLAPAPAAPIAAVATPAPKGEVTSATPKAGATMAPKPEAVIAVAAPAPAPAPVRYTPAQLYRAVCIQCHDLDGRGKIVRAAMPTIPDLTDPKWHASRTDAELQHSVLEGKGQFMLSMKDKFALTGIDPKDMVAFMRSFQPGKPAVATPTPARSTPARSTPSPVVASAPTAAAAGPTSNPAPTAPPTTAPPASPFPAPPASPSAAALALANASPIPNLNFNLNPIPSPSALSASPSATAPAPTPSSSRTSSTAPSPERAARLRVAGEFYNMNCAACHGPDGRGSTIRIAMPVIPDFTSRDWHMSHENPQLAISILEGKGVLMPPWRGKVEPALAQDLVAFIRGFGPADLVSASATRTEFGTRFRQLRQQWQELDQQARALAGP